jgi:hypothetical protein
MLIGVPKEIKVRESRVGLTPTGVRELVSHGHQVLVQTEAGSGAVSVKQVVASISRGFRLCGVFRCSFSRAIGRQGYRRGWSPVTCPT